VSPGQWGNATYAYDPLDNLRSADQGTRQYRYSYNASNRLSQIKTPAGANVFTFGYDARGNVTTKGSQGYGFDAANRLSAVTGLQSYRYDAMGRRVQTTDAGTNKTTFWIYSQAGQVLYTSEARRSQNLDYIYLGNSQIATRAWTWGTPTTTVTVKYEHTDTLGSPVAETSSTGAVLKRNSYAPYGEAYAPTVIDGTGYTGHVMDQATGLTYMQQRYYDPQVGRFLSVDPMPMNPNNGSNFNRFGYAAENPYRFVDPDGREDCDATCRQQKAETQKTRRQRTDARQHVPAPSQRSNKPLNDPCNQCTLIHPADGSAPFYVPTAVAGQSLTATITPGASINPPPLTKKQAAIGVGIVAVSATGVGLGADAVGAVAVAETSSDVAITAGVGAAALDHSKTTGVVIDLGLKAIGSLTGLGPIIDMTLGAMKWGHDAAESADEVTKDQQQ
jgi:RHS repeat-associated protein